MKSATYVSQIEPHYIAHMSALNHPSDNRIYSVDGQMVILLPVISGSSPYDCIVSYWESHTFNIDQRLHKLRMTDRDWVLEFCSWYHLAIPSENEVTTLYLWRGRKRVYKQSITYFRVLTKEPGVAMSCRIPQWHIGLVGDLVAAKR